jgi:hypothetical protein
MLSISKVSHNSQVAIHKLAKTARKNYFYTISKIKSSLTSTRMLMWMYTVQANQDLLYCRTGSCTVTVATRKKCPYCRYIVV